MDAVAETFSCVDGVGADQAACELDEGTWTGNDDAVDAVENTLTWDPYTWVEIGPIIKEDIYWSWPPMFEGDRIFVKTSSIEFYQNVDNVDEGSFLNYTQPINLDELQNNEDFDFEPFKLSNTMGLQRVIVPE